MDSASETTPSPRLRPAEWGGALAALAAASGWLFGRVLFLDAALHARDVLHHYWPLHEAVRRALADGRLPLWDPTLQGGMPLLANPHAAVFYPPNLLYLLLDFPRAYAWLVASHHLALGLGAWWLLRRWYAQPAALAGALVLVLSGPIASLNTYGPLLCSLTWLPWTLGVLARPFAWRRKVALTGVLLALQVVGGDPMPVLLTAIGALALLAVVEDRRAVALAFGAGLALAGLLAAVQVLPALELLSQSVRAGGVGAEHWSLHPARLFETLLPDVFGHYLEAPGYWGNFLSNGPVRIPFFLSAYFGAGASVVAVAGLRRSRGTVVALALVALGILLALGARFLAGPLLAHVPPFSFFRYPEKYLLVSLSGWVLLVAQGFERGACVDGVRARTLGPLAVGLGAVALAGPARPALGALLADTLARPGFRFPLEQVAEAVQAAGLAAVAAAGFVAVLPALRRWLPGQRAAWLLVAAVALDLALCAQRTVWTGPLVLYRERPELVAALDAASPRHPFRIFRDNARLEQRAQRTGTYEGMAARRAFDVLTLKSAIGTAWGLEDVAGSAVVLRRGQDLIRALAKDQARALALYNVCLALGPDDGPLASMPGVSPRGRPAPGVGLFEIPGCVPRARFAPAARGVEGPAAALAVLASADFAAGADAVVEGLVPSPLDGAARVVALRPEPSGRVTAEIDAPSGGLLVFSVSWYPGWTAHIDGHAAEVLPADGAFLAVWIPAGAREVVLEFGQRRLGWGVLLTSLGVVAALTLAGERHLSRFVGRSRREVTKSVTTEIV